MLDNLFFCNFDQMKHQWYRYARIFSSFDTLPLGVPGLVESKFRSLRLEIWKYWLQKSHCEAVLLFYVKARSVNPSWKRVCWFCDARHLLPPHKFERNWFQNSYCVTWKKSASKVPVWYSTFILQEGKILEPNLKKGLLVLRGSTFTASSQYANVIWRYGQNQAEGGSQGPHCCVLTRSRPVTI